jgi:hypothetical protein
LAVSAEDVMSLIGEGMEIMGLINKAQNVEVYKQLGDWIEKVLALQRQVDELSRERNDLKEQVRFKGVLERVNGHTFVQGDDEEICPRCAEVDSKAVHLVSVHSKIMPGQKAGCPNCKLVMIHNLPKKRNPGQILN